MAARLAACALLVTGAAAVAEPAGAEIVAPRGVQISTVARGVGQPSNIAFDVRGGMWLTSAGYGNAASDGVWYVSRPGARAVHVVNRIYTALGLSWFRGELFVSHVVPYEDGARHRGVVVAYSGFDGRRFGRRRVVLRDLPVGLHNVDSIVPGPEDRLFLGIGSIHDNRATSRRLSSTVISFRPDGRGVRVEGRGFRNPYGLAFVPGTTDLLVTDNGRDDLGLHRPPEELNLLPIPGPAPFFGFARCWGQGGPACRGSRDPLAKLPAHASSDGLAVAPRFGRYGMSAFVAQLGSSFARKPTGNDVLRIALRPRPGGGYHARAFPFARGFRKHDPLGAAIGPDRALYVTLHASGKVVRFSPPPATPAWHLPLFRALLF